MKIFGDEQAKTDLETLRRQLAQWRELNSGKKIPDEHWKEATRLARILGAPRVAANLRLWRPRLDRFLLSSATRPPSKNKAQPKELSFMKVPLSESSSVVSQGEVKEARFLCHIKLRLGTLKLEWR